MSSDNTNEIEQGKVVDAVNRFKERVRVAESEGKVEEPKPPWGFRNVYQLPGIVEQAKVMLCVPLGDGGIALSKMMYRVKTVRANGTLVVKPYKQLIGEED